MRAMSIPRGYALGMTIQVAVKLPDGLMGEVDRLVEGGEFASRSQAIRRGLEVLVAQRRRDELAEQYREAMAQHPETEAELAEAHRLAIDAIDEEPWERWW